MYRTVQIVSETSVVNTVFLNDADTGNTAKDVLSVPGIFDELQSKTGTDMKLMHITGTIGAYHTAMFALVVDASVDTEDVTEELSKYLTLPETAARMMLRAIPEEDRQELITDMLNTVHHYEGIQESSRLCVPASAFMGLTPEQTAKMTSQRKSYVLKNTENQEIFQTSFDADFGVLLPSLEDIHSGSSDLVSALDVLRVVMPFRKQERPGVYSYNGIYHTPYYKVDHKLQGMVPSYYSWINGYSVNDMLDIQDNERHMANNLRMLICSDISRYVAELTSGIFFDSPLGSLLAKLCTKKDEEVMQQLLSDIKERNTGDSACNIPYNEIDELVQNGWYQADVVRTIRKNLVLADDFLYKLIEERPVDRRTIECDNLPFTLQLSDSQEQQFTEMMISMGYMSVAMQRFLLDLCKKAYRVNWGHTGATLAIPGFVAQAQLEGIDKEIGSYLTDCSGGQLPEPGKYPQLYILSATSPDADSMSVISDSDAEEADDDPSARLDYYVTPDTAQKIRLGMLSFDYFSTKPSAAQTTEAAVIEYWRNINGENNLDNFLSSALLRTADITILIESFVKLMRWGDRKPKLLVLQKHPEIRHVFDMGTGLRVDNTAIVDEAELVKHNGCDYSLESFLYSNSNPTLKPEQVIGFKLYKDYGSVKKVYLASWLDLGEMAVRGEIKIGEFAAVTQISVSEETMEAIEDYSRAEYDFYVSDENIAAGLKDKIQPKELNALALLTTPAIMNSREYLRSLKGDHIITTRDRQYDILRRYVAAVNDFYVQKGAAINGVTNTIELNALAEEFYHLFQNQGGEKQSANSATASSTLKTLNLGGLTTSADVVKWDSTELSGKFILISDREMASTLPPIEFTNPQLKAVAAKANNRVVMLLLATGNKYIFCRKDITPDQVMLVKSPDGKGGFRQTVANKAYTGLSSLIANLMKGVDGTINKQPAYLHETLKDYL